VKADVAGRIREMLAVRQWRSGRWEANRCDAVSLDRVDWNAELLRGELKAVQQLKRESARGLPVAGAKLAQTLAELGLIELANCTRHRAGCGGAAVANGIKGSEQHGTP